MDIGDSGSSPWDDVPSTNAAPAKEGTKPEDSNDIDSSSASLTSPTTSSAPAAKAGPRGTRPARRYGATSTVLQAVDDTMDPLGPLGASEPTEEPDFPTPTNPRQDSMANSKASLATSRSSLPGMMDSVDLNSDVGQSGQLRTKPSPAVQPPNQDGRSAQPRSVGVVEAARPTFSIYVGDPHKVGDLTSSHTEYSVITRTTSKAYRNPEFTVSRRFRDFLWLYNQLHQNNPGIIVPPPPEKQAVGRFNSDFVESRRQALERMLNKTAAHPALQHDADLKLFLESEAFNVDVKHRERKEPLVGESKGGMFSAIGIGSSGSKFVEHDDWFHDRKVYLDALENQLKALEKALDTVVTQRKSLAEACGDFSGSLHSLAAVELSPLLSGPLDGLSELQTRIRDLYDRQAQQDVLTLGIVIDEYIRMIGSCKMAFTMRQKSYHGWRSAEDSLEKKRSGQDKLLRQGKSQTDKLNQISAEVADAEKKAHQARLLFDDTGRLMRQELERFEREKVDDFKSGVETFLESAVEAQKELIEMWETYLMRLDADEAEEQQEQANNGAEAPAPTKIDEPEFAAAPSTSEEPADPAGLTDSHEDTSEA